MATIYVAVLNEQYRCLLATGLSATEAEYLRAREAASGSPSTRPPTRPREGHPNRFIERVHTFVTTESYRDIADSTVACAAARTSSLPRRSRRG